ncbi:MAG: methylisocitrate lyase [Candidatus Thioglobus sp.]|jgi:methylisocitrate lyase|nr:methylisocitrate lyase [Candidatus Thioglobus sp.]|tara:strand:- start:2825 stop:3718 length:894 start_codon:yes stop_codon:yes gene_type:complete
MMSQGKQFREAVKENELLQCLGATTAYHALLAEKSGAKALYVSGGGVAAGSLGVPDLGISTLNDVAIDVERICSRTNLPVLVDIDTGWGGSLNIARAINTLEKAGAAAIHIEDQVQQKRCGHRPNKVLVPKAEMLDRIKSAVDARINDDFVIMARTDSLAHHGLEAAIDIMGACVEAGADMVFPEAVSELAVYKKITKSIAVPVLANITEFGKTPLLTTDELISAGIKIALYPLSAFRAANQAALNVYQQIMSNGSQQSVLETMQTREELYQYLGYHEYEQQLDQLLTKGEDDVNII